MTIEKIQLSPEDKDFAQKYSDFRQVPVEEIEFNLRDPELRPDFLKKAEEKISRALTLALNAHKTCRGVKANYNRNQPFNTREGQHTLKEKFDVELIDKLVRATGRGEADIKKYWTDDTMIDIIINEALINVAKADVKDASGIDDFLLFLSKNLRFHLALQKNQALVESWQPFEARFPLADIDSTEPNPGYANQD